MRDDKGRFIKGHRGFMLGIPLTEEAKEKLRKVNLGSKRSIESRLKQSASLIGKPGRNKGKHWKCKDTSKMKGRIMSLETRLKISQKLSGEKSYLWQGGKTEERERLRKSIEYKLWRKSVFVRDNYTCIWCGQYGGCLEADHIKPWSLYPEFRFAIDNGRTLCHNCHKKTETYLIKARYKN